MKAGRRDALKMLGGGAIAALASWLAAPAVFGKGSSKPTPDAVDPRQHIKIKDQGQLGSASGCAMATCMEMVQGVTGEPEPVTRTGRQMSKSTNLGSSPPSYLWDWEDEERHQQQLAREIEEDRRACYVPADKNGNIWHADGGYTDLSSLRQSGFLNDPAKTIAFKAIDDKCYVVGPATATLDELVWITDELLALREGCTLESNLELRIVNPVIRWLVRGEWMMQSLQKATELDDALDICGRLFHENRQFEAWVSASGSDLLSELDRYHNETQASLAG